MTRLDKPSAIMRYILSHRIKRSKGGQAVDQLMQHQLRSFLHIEETQPRRGNAIYQNTIGQDVKVSGNL